MASLLCAIISWSIVTLTFDSEGAREFTVSEINYSYNSNAYTSMGLSIVDAPQVGSVRVRVEGSGTVIGQLSASDLMVYPNYANVSGSGEQTLTLQARVASSQFSSNDITLTVISPTTATIVFDRVSEKTLPVTVDSNGLSVADGYMLYRSNPVPSEVTITGPQSELDAITSVVAPVTVDSELSDSTSVTTSLELRDENGNTITPEYAELDNASANVTLTVYQVRELPLAVDFINVPTGFDTSSLNYSLSQETMLVAGPTRTVSALTELSVVSFDLGQQFALDRDYQLQVELPSGLVALDDAGQEAFAVLFRTGWFIESALTQMLVVHTQACMYSRPVKIKRVRKEGEELFILFGMEERRGVGDASMPAQIYLFVVMDALDVTSIACALKIG